MPEEKLCPLAMASSRDDHEKGLLIFTWKGVTSTGDGFTALF